MPYLKSKHFPVSGQDDLDAKDVSETQTTFPLGTVSWWPTGTPGSSFQIKLRRQTSSGGHMHAGGPTGTIQPQTGTIPASGTIEAIYTAPEICGLIVVETTIGNQSVAPDYVRVSIGAKLEALVSSQSVVLIGQKPQHPENHYGHPSLIALLNRLAASFYKKFSIPLAVNDISLAMGGLFDIQSTWAPPHKSHRNGLNADLRTAGLSVTQLKYLKDTAISIGLRVLPEDGPPHYHITLEPEAWVVEMWDSTMADAQDSFFSSVNSAMGSR